MDKLFRITYRTASGHRATSQVRARKASAARAVFAAAYGDFGWTVVSVRVVR